MTHRVVPRVFFLGFALAIITAFFILPRFYETPTAANPAKFHLLWSKNIEKRVYTQPVIFGHVLVYGTSEGFLEAISIESGEREWSYKLSDFVFSLGLDQNGIVYAGTGLHTSERALLVAVEPLKGRVLWQKEFAGHIEEPALVDNANNQLWFGAGPGSLWSIDVDTGKSRWNKELGHLDATPLLYKEILYVPAEKNPNPRETYFYALDARSGDILWQVEQPGQPWGAPILDKTESFILTNTGIGQIGLVRDTDRGWAQAVSLDGKTLWETQLPDMAMTPNIYAPSLDHIISVTKRGVIIALDTRTGKEVWTTKLEGEFMSPPVAISETSFAVSSKDGVLYVLDAANGAILYQHKMAASSSMAPAVHDGIVYFVADHNITAMKMVTP